MEERKQSSRLGLWLGAAIVVVIVFFVARSLTREKLPVREAKVSRQQLVNQISTNGRVQPVANFEVHSPLATSVKQLYVQQGDQVQVGKVLLELDDLQAKARVATAESGLKSAQSALDSALHNGSLAERQNSESEVTRARIERDQAKTSLDALTKLRATGAASASEVASAQQRLDTDEAALTAAQSGAKSRYAPSDVARAQAAVADAEAGLAAARDVEAKTRPTAPFAGTVYSLNVGRWEFAEEGKLLMQIADLHHMRIVAYFDEPEIGQLAVGQPVEIKWNAKPGQVWKGHISRVPSTVIIMTSGTRTVGETLVDVDGSDGGLLPDTNVTVTVTTSSEANALTIPREALLFEGGRTFVFKIVDDKLVRTLVTVGPSNLVLTPVLSGLQEDDVVATGTTNGLPLQAGVPVKVVQ